MGTFVVIEHPWWAGVLSCPFPRALARSRAMQAHRAPGGAIRRAPRAST
jgi:hypothetical protein